MTTTCGRCEGTGAIETGEIEQDTGYHVEATCPDCQGEGTFDNGDDDMHASDCSIWVNERCDCVMGRIDREYDAADEKFTAEYEEGQ